MNFPSRRRFLRAALALGGAAAAARMPAAEPADDLTRLAPGKALDLFDGKSLDGWQKTAFGGEGDVEVEDGAIVLAMGNDLTGVTTTRKPPTRDYEIRVEAKRLAGNDLFCGLTFPVDDQFCSFVCGGWGGATVGLSSIDGKDASDNDTRSLRLFEADRWYAIRVRVTKERVDAWIDADQAVAFARGSHALSTRVDVRLSQPLGLITWRTTSAFRTIRLTRLPS